MQTYFQFRHNIHTKYKITFQLLKKKDKIICIGKCDTYLRRMLGTTYYFVNKNENDCLKIVLFFYYLNHKKKQLLKNVLFKISCF